MYCMYGSMSYSISSYQMITTINNINLTIINTMHIHSNDLTHKKLYINKSYTDSTISTNLCIIHTRPKHIIVFNLPFLHFFDIAIAS